MGSARQRGDGLPGAGRVRAAGSGRERDRGRSGLWCERAGVGCEGILWAVLLSAPGPDLLSS